MHNFDLFLLAMCFDVDFYLLNFYRVQWDLHNATVHNATTVSFQFWKIVCLFFFFFLLHHWLLSLSMFTIIQWLVFCFYHPFWCLGHFLVSFFLSFFSSYFSLDSLLPLCSECFVHLSPVLLQINSLTQCLYCSRF